MGLRVTFEKLNANSPALFGMIFKAKSERADTTLLLYGFFSEGLPTIIALGLNSFLSLASARHINAPAPCPK